MSWFGSASRIERAFEPQIWLGKADVVAYTLIETAKLNAVDPLARLADTLARIPDYKITKVDDLLPWRWNG